MKGNKNSIIRSLQGIAGQVPAMRASAFALKQFKSYETFENCGNGSSFRVDDFLLLASAGRPLVRDLPNAGYDSVAPFKEHRPEQKFVFNNQSDHIYQTLGSDSSTRHSQKRHVVRTRAKHSLTSPKKSDLNCHRYYTTGQLSQ